MSSPPDDRACKGLDTDLFYPEDEHGNDDYTNENPTVQEAKAVCAGCPLAAFQWCQDTHQYEQHGIFFGTTPAERRKMA